MAGSAQSTAELQFSARAFRGNSDAPASAAALAQNVNDAVRWASVTEAGEESANAAIQQVFTGGERNARARAIDPAPASVSSALAASFHALQEWEGYVVDVRETEFVARLVDITASASHEGEEATFPRAELSDGDDAKLCDGSIFRWVIGYERSPAGTKKRVSQIVFRDLPALTRSDLRDGEAWAREMAESLGP